MKLNCFITFFFLIFVVKTYSQQNLVPNPSFEIYDTCPNTSGQINYAVNWSSYANSPDYFNVCADTSSLFSIPYSGFGYQYPHTGNAYCGFYAYGNPTPHDYREILGVTLITPLMIGTKYYISFFVNLSYGYLAHQNFFPTRTKANKIGVRFSTIPHSIYNPAPVNNFAHIYTDSIITDTLNWVIIKGEFTADSAYRYLSVGNFFDDAHTDTLMFPTNFGSLGAYYFVDDVCVSTDSSYSLNWWTGITAFKNEDNLIVYPNPSCGRIFINIMGVHKQSITIRDIYGRELSESEIHITNNYIDFTNSGIYFITINNSNSTYTKKIIINK